MGEVDEKATAVLNEIEGRNEEIVSKVGEMGERLEAALAPGPLPYVPKPIGNAEYEQRLWREIERLRCALHTIIELAEGDERVREVARDALLGGVLRD